MKPIETTSFIFYLTLSETLPSAFYTFNKHFKDLGYMLVPIRIDQLQSILSASEQTQIVVISSVTDSKEMKQYNEKVRSLLKYVLKSKRLTFMLLSSFSRLSDSKIYFKQKNYYFMKYPIDAGLFSKKITRYYELKSEQNVLRWPGGRRAGVGAIS